MQYLLLFVLALSICVTGHVFANSGAESLIQLSYEQTQAGKLDDALKTLQQAIKEDPSSSLAYTRLGGVRLLRQEYSEGIKEFQQAIMLDNKNAPAFIGMAVAYLHMGQYKLARAALDEAGKLDPAKLPEIEKVLMWIEQRSSAANASTH